VIFCFCTLWFLFLASLSSHLRNSFVFFDLSIICLIYCLTEKFFFNSLIFYKILPSQSLILLFYFLHSQNGDYFSTPNRSISYYFSVCSAFFSWHCVLTCETLKIYNLNIHMCKPSCKRKNESGMISTSDENQD